MNKPHSIHKLLGLPSECNRGNIHVLLQKEVTVILDLL